MIKFNTKSWHYRMHRFGHMDEWVHDRTSFCPYARKVLRGLILFSLLWTLILGAAIWNIMGVIMLAQGFWTFSGFAGLVNIFTAGAIAAVLVAVGVGLTHQHICEWQDGRRAQKRGQKGEAIKPDSFVVTWAKNLHSKVCPTVEFIKD